MTNQEITGYLGLSEDTQVALVYASESEREEILSILSHARFIELNHIALVSAERAKEINASIKQLDINDLVLPAKLEPAIFPIKSYVIEEIPRHVMIELPRHTHQRQVVPHSNKRNNFKKKKRR